MLCGRNFSPRGRNLPQRGGMLHRAMKHGTVPACDYNISVRGKKYCSSAKTTVGRVDLYAHVVKLLGKRGGADVSTTAVLPRKTHHEVESHFSHSSSLWTTNVNNAAVALADLEMFITPIGSDFYPLIVETFGGMVSQQSKDIGN